MIDIKIKVGELTLINSGSIIAPPDAPIHFYIHDLEFVLIFVNDDKEKPHIKQVYNTGKKLELELANFNDMVGVGNIEPLSMGKIDDNELLLMLRVSKLSAGGKTVHYSWYVKEKS